MILIEQCKREGSLDALKKEREHLEQLKASLNVIIPTRYIQEYLKDNRERISEHNKQYNEANKERRQKYNEYNRERIREYTKNYHEANKTKIKGMEIR